MFPVDTLQEGQSKTFAKMTNGIAMASLTMTLTSEGSNGIITQTYDTDWPKGLAYKVNDPLFRDMSCRI